MHILTDSLETSGGSLISEVLKEIVYFQEQPQQQPLDCPLHLPSRQFFLMPSCNSRQGKEATHPSLQYTSWVLISIIMHTSICTSVSCNGSDIL